MFEVAKEIEFDAGHRVPTHQGKCRSPHGHRYRVQVVCAAEHLPEDAMVVDFGILGDLLRSEVHDVLDHGMIVWEEDLDLRKAMEYIMSWKVVRFPYIPTAENIARWTWEQLEPKLSDQPFWLSTVVCWETPTCYATYSKDDDG